MQYVILLRGINVGGRNIKMAALKTCFEQAGFTQVVTVLQTGNVVVTSGEKNSDKLKKQVESLLSDTFGYQAKVLVVTPRYLETVIQHYPFSGFGPEFHRYAVFTDVGNEKELMRSLGQLDSEVEAVMDGQGVIYWRVLKGHTLDSQFGKYIGKVGSRQFLTNRNLNTLEKILQKCG